MIEIKNQKEFDETIKSEKTTLAYFSALWCSPCKTQIPILEEFAGSNPDVQIIKVNVDENPDLTTSYEIRNIPTIIYFKNNKIIGRTAGIQQLKALNEKKIELA